MIRVLLIGITLGLLVTLGASQKYRHQGKNRIEDKEDGCGVCRPHECERPQGCVAGLVKDSCGCCDVCGKAEFELCDHPRVPHYPGEDLGKCGDNLDCRLRDDLAEEEGPEAICYCKITGVLCGSDGKSYENLCQLMAAGVRAEQKITIKDKGACSEAPVIISHPENAKNKTGESVAIVCEARGFPIPTIEWTWSRVDGQTNYLPSDDLRVSVNMRGGPEKRQVTGWLQIMELDKEHEGDYTCIAQNKHGMAEATARINVVTDEDALKKKTRSWDRNN